MAIAKVMKSFKARSKYVQNTFKHLQIIEIIEVT